MLNNGAKNNSNNLKNMDFLAYHVQKEKACSRHTRLSRVLFGKPQLSSKAHLN